ncbi:hypothetical protein FVEG_09974 [Fusarium verticillioides 7600]|uniref:SnoaL-like domain-containing protein n=1 Tax=Gibberella moniliformis (strain M3125 / FGSC 7600) TaxID=334819 RepID=W7MGL4_GIBM7|nr:hypothetical protein FVEG_09974 [Fusarium verticillioides 7600]EWG50843.1 hypothetical protein FVEG_09974 [Fusarium verticillioides 7600]
MDSQEFKNVLQRLRKLEDESALDSLLNRYCWQVDLMNWEEFGKTYIEDARMDFEAFGEIRGRENIVKATIQAEERFESMQHSITNREFTINYYDDSLNGRTSDRATATAYLIFAITEDSRKSPGKHFKMGGPYHFEFERIYDPDTDEGKAWNARGWRISSMKLRLIWTENEEIDKFGVFTKGKAKSLR